MHKKWISWAAAAVLLCSVLGCSGDAKASAENHLDEEIPKAYPAGVVYLTSRDGFSGSATFTPDRSQQMLAIVGTCFATDRDDMPELRMLQGSELVTTFGTYCSSDEGWGAMVPALFDPDGEEVTIEISEADAKDFAFRVVGYNE